MSPASLSSPSVRLPDPPPPRAERGPEMCRLDPFHEIRDSPCCEIGDMPLSVADDGAAPANGDSRFACATFPEHAS